MGEIIWHADFNKRRRAEFDAAQVLVIRALCLIIDQAGGKLTVTEDTAPCEYIAQESDPA